MYEQSHGGDVAYRLRIRALRVGRHAARHANTVSIARIDVYVEAVTVTYKTISLSQPDRVPRPLHSG